MGYRSDAAIVITHKAYDNLIEKIQELENEKLKAALIILMTEGCEVKEIAADKEYVALYFPSVRWYGDKIEYLEEYLKNEKHDKIIIGEDYDDIEVYYGTDEYLIEVDRKIIFN